MKKSILVIFSVLLFFSMKPVFAEGGKIEAGDFGFSFFTGIPISDEFMVGNAESIARYYGIGCAYHPVDFLSIEPGFFFFDDKSDNKDKLSGSSSEGESVIIGGSIALFYNLNLKESFYMYAGPRFDIAKSGYDSDASDGSGREDRDMYTSVSAILGFKYLFNEHIAIFADMGISYYFSNETEKSWNSSGTLTTNTERNSDNFALSRGVIGITFYL